jgi:hypothetical protein
MRSPVSAMREPPAGVRQVPLAATAAIVLLGGLLGFAAGARGPRGAPASAPIELRDGLPVGVLHSPAGALAAADAYLMTDAQTIERDPRRFATLVRTVFAPGLRAAVLSAAASTRARDPGGMALWAVAGRSATLIGAHRLDTDIGTRVRVSAWVGTVAWGPGRPPAQSWALDQIALRWSAGRWWVTALSSAASDAPEPARTPQADPADDGAGIFDNALAGFSAIGSGAPAR